MNSIPVLNNLQINEEGVQFHFPQSLFSGNKWKFRGGNLCAWNTAIIPKVQNREIIVDPVIGRILIGVNDNNEALSIKDNLLMTYTYGAAGNVGCHPVSRTPPPQELNNETVNPPINVFYRANPNGLRDALSNLQDSTSPTLIEIMDSMVYTLDLGDPLITGIKVEDGGPNLQLNRSLIIRSSGHQRPVIKLKVPLRFRPANVVGSTPEEQNKFDAVMDNLTVHLEGLYITRDDTFPPDAPLIARAALNSLEIVNCTLDPGGSRKLDGTIMGSRYPMRNSTELKMPYGF